MEASFIIQLETISCEAGCVPAIPALGTRHSSPPQHQWLLSPPFTYRALHSESLLFQAVAKQPVSNILRAVGHTSMLNCGTNLDTCCCCRVLLMELNIGC